MTIEESIAALTTATTALTTAVGVQQTSVNNALVAFNAVINRVNNELNLVNNTADTAKPISTATQSALNLKQALLVSGVNISTVNGVSLLSGAPLVIARGATSLTKVAYEGRGALRALLPTVDDSAVVEGLGLFMFVNTIDEPDDDETCFTTANGQWLLEIAALDLILSWDSFEISVREDYIEDESIRFKAYLKQLNLI